MNCRHREKAYRYDARGRRVDPRGGVYWIPADRFDEIVARAKHCPQILNDFDFEAEHTHDRCKCS